MFKCFFFPSFFFGFAVVNFGAFDFDEEIMIEEGNDIKKDKGKEKEENKDKKEEKRIGEKGNIDKENEEQDNDEDLNIYNNKKEDINNVRVDELSKDENIEKKQVRNAKILVVSHEDNFERLVLYYYIAVSFLLYAYKKVDSTTNIFSELGDEQYDGPLDDDVFAVYKEFSGNDSKSMSTYYYCLSRVCGDALKDFLLGDNKKKISYSEAYEKMYARVNEFLSKVEKIDIKLEENGWQDEFGEWAFTVALQVFAYKKIYEHLNKNNISLEGNNQNAALQHDLVYVKFLSEMLYNIFKNVLESFLSDAGNNTIRSRDLFFLRGLKPKNIWPENQKNMFYSAFSNLVFRPALLDGSVRTFLDCFFPIKNQLPLK